MISRYLKIGDFVKVNSAHCQKSAYGRHDTLIEAKLACNEDIECLGVYDQKCDGSFSYRLCPISNLTEYSIDSCLHRKKEFSGHLSL